MPNRTEAMLRLWSRRSAPHFRTARHSSAVGINGKGKWDRAIPLSRGPVQEAATGADSGRLRSSAALEHRASSRLDSPNTPVMPSARARLNDGLRSSCRRALDFVPAAAIHAGLPTVASHRGFFSTAAHRSSASTALARGGRSARCDEAPPRLQHSCPSRAAVHRTGMGEASRSHASGLSAHDGSDLGGLRP